MKKYFLIFLLPIFISCKKNSDQKIISKKTIHSTIKTIHLEDINDTLKNKINVDKFLDSIIKPEKIKLIKRLEESYSEKEKINFFSSEKYTFKLKTDGYSDESNSIFIEGNHKINFKNLTVLKFNTDDFKSEEFGFNFENNLNNANIIEILGNKFLYADLTFKCNGIGCGCQLNFIYDLKNKKAFVIDNYRFPYNKIFLSDYNDDKILDLMVISRKNSSEVNIPYEKVSYLISWFENKNGNFISRKVKNKNSSIIISAYFEDFHHSDKQTDFYIEKLNWN